MSSTRERTEAVTFLEMVWSRRVAQASGILLLSGATLNIVLTAVAPQTYADLGPWMGGPAPLQQRVTHERVVRLHPAENSC